MNFPVFRVLGVSLVLTALTTALSVSQAQEHESPDRGSLKVHDGGQSFEFRPTEQPEYRIRVNRKGEQRLLAGWRQPGQLEAVAQLAGLPDGKGRYGLMISFRKDGSFRSYSAGCNPDTRKPCDQTSFAMTLDLAAGSISLDDVEFKRDTLAEGSEAKSKIRVTGTLRLLGKPEQR